MKKNKQEETMNPLVSLRRPGSVRTGAIFQHFSVKRRQAQGERESESRAKGGVKNKTTKKTPKPLCTPR